MTGAHGHGGIVGAIGRKWKRGSFEMLVRRVGDFAAGRAGERVLVGWPLAAGSRDDNDTLFVVRSDGKVVVF